MANEYCVSVSKIIDELSLNVVNIPDNGGEILVCSRNVSRPALELTGFFEHYNNKRILVIGNTEYAYLDKLTDEQRMTAMDNLLKRQPPAIVICRGLPVEEDLLTLARKHNTVILSTTQSTSVLIADLVSFLSAEMAPRITRHGVLMEIYGQGALIVGDSGVGKSETAIELIKRGHRLVADDAVEIKRISQKALMGSAPENIRHFIELRGIGIINARRLFGMGAVKLESKLDLVINLENWDRTKVYDRMGLDEESTKILGIDIPILTIPVKPGRNLAVIIEVAAMNNRQKVMGYNAAKELLESLGMGTEIEQTEKSSEIEW